MSVLIVLVAAGSSDFAQTRDATPPPDPG